MDQGIRKTANALAIETRLWEDQKVHFSVCENAFFHVKNYKYRIYHFNKISMRTNGDDKMGWLIRQVNIRVGEHNVNYKSRRIQKGLEVDQ